MLACTYASPFVRNPYMMIDLRAVCVSGYKDSILRSRLIPYVKKREAKIFRPVAVLR